MINFEWQELIIFLALSVTMGLIISLFILYPLAWSNGYNQCKDDIRAEIFPLLDELNVTLTIFNEYYGTDYKVRIPL